MSDTPHKRFGVPTRIVTLVALVLAPIVGAVAAILVVTIYRLALDAGAGLSIEEIGSLVFTSALYGALLGVAPSLVLGLPLHSLLLSKRVTGLLAYLGLGLVVAVLGLMAVLSFWNLAGVVFIPLVALAFATGGAAGGAFFWLIRRPDRDVAPVALK